MENIRGIKVIQALEKNKGLAVWIYDRADELPKYCQSFNTFERDGFIEYHSPEAIYFWKHNDLYGNPIFFIDFSYRAIVTDKRKK